MTTEEYNKHKEELIAKRDALYDEYIAISDEIRDLELGKLADMNHKFYKVKDSSYDDDYQTYLFVKDSFLSTDLSGDKALILNCISFRGCISAYMDSTYMRWDQHDQIYIKCEREDVFEARMKCFKEITEEEFNKEFNALMQSVIEEQNSFKFNKFIEANKAKD